MEITDHLMDGPIMATTEDHESTSAIINPFVLGMRSPSPNGIAPIKRSRLMNGTQDALSRSPSLRPESTSNKMAVKKLSQLPYVTSQTGLVYDVRMRFHVEVKPEANQGVHPEDPRRIYSIYKELVDAGLVDDPGSPGLSPYVLGRIAARFATRDEICAVHTKEHYDFIIELERM